MPLYHWDHSPAIVLQGVSKNGIQVLVDIQSNKWPYSKISLGTVLYNVHLSICLLHILLFCDFYCFKSGISLGHPVKDVVRKHGESGVRTWPGYLLSYLVCCCCCWGGCPLQDLPWAGPPRWAPCWSWWSWSLPAASGSTCPRCASTWRTRTQIYQKSWIIRNPGLSKIPDYQNHKAYSFLKRSQNNGVNILWAFCKKFFFYCFPTS